MGLFKKKPDPVSERAKALDDQIAALEAEIKKLSEKPPADRPAPPETPSAIPNFGTAARAPASQPRLRSTARPHRQLNEEAPQVHEPIFEQVNQPQIKADTELPVPPPDELGTRKSDLTSLWQRIMRHFRGPVTSNPKLVNYLAAGSIQGLQPLRYEKRVARNRFIVFAVFLVLALWGLIAMLLSKR